MKNIQSVAKKERKISAPLYFLVIVVSLGCGRLYLAVNLEDNLLSNRYRLALCGSRTVRALNGIRGMSAVVINLNR